MSRPSSSTLVRAIRGSTRLNGPRTPMQISGSCRRHLIIPPAIRRFPLLRPSPKIPRPPPSRSYSSPFPTAPRRSLLRPLNFLVVCVPIVTLYLGIWQIRRLRWKVALIEEVERNLAREPMVLPANINVAALPEFAFRRVFLQGDYKDPPILLGPQVKDGVPGYSLVQPFHRSDPGSSTILVNRGFITSTRATAIREGRERPPVAEGDSEKGGDVVVEGMLSKKFDTGRRRWQPDNEPEKNQWFWKDVEGMADWCGVDRGVQPVLVDAIDYGEQPSTLLMQQGIPVGRPPSVEIRNQHATYAATWFILSAATTGMLIFLLRKSKRGSGLPRSLYGRI